MSKIYDLIAKLRFWYVKRFFRLNVHYTFYFDLTSEQDSFAVKLLKRYQDTIVEYSNVRCDENNLLTFDFNVIANPRLHDIESQRFKNFTSNVMRSMILNSIENATREPNENRNIDTLQSDEERVLHEESVAVSEERVSKRKPRKKTVRRNKAVHSKV